MLKQSAWLIIFVAAATGFAADFNVDFHRKYREAVAERLLSERKYVEAQEAFEELAATGGNAVEQCKWTARAAIALGHQKDKYDQAMEMAKGIEERPYSVYAQMELMTSKRDYSALVKAFKKEKIAAWPSYEVPRRPRHSVEDARTYACFARGRAFYETGDGESAEKDLSKAAELANGVRLKHDILLLLAYNCERHLNDEKKAFQAYSRIAEGKGGGATYYRGVIGTANYLSKQKKYDEALETLDKMRPHHQRGWWHGAGLLTLGRILTDAGRPQEAIAAYRELLEGGEAHRNHRGPAALSLGELLVETGEKEEAIAAYKKLLADEKARSDDREKAEQAIKELGGAVE